MYLPLIYKTPIISSLSKTVKLHHVYFKQTNVSGEYTMFPLYRLGFTPS